MPGSLEALRALRQYARLATGLAEIQRTPNPPDFAELIRRQMENRESNFLRMARYVLEQPGNLYRVLFDRAGVTYADLERAVQRDGLRTALDGLLEAGIFIRHAEFRGKEPVVRDGREIPWNPADMASPWGRGTIEHSTSGSTGARFTTTLGLEMLLHRTAYEAVSIRDHGLESRPRILVSSILPSVWPMRHAVAWHRLDSPVHRWFALGIEASRAWHYAAATRYMVAQSRFLGGRIPYPEMLPDNDFTVVAACLAEYCRAGTPAVIRATASPATRIAAAALAQGLDISGTHFSVSGEPLSDAKREVIESTGSRVYPQYHSAEFGTFGYSCRHMRDGNRVHLFQESLMVVSRPREEPGQNALFVSSLMPISPRILINVEVDDSAVIEPVNCDCEFSRLGFNLQLRDICSYGKITAQGITIEAADLLHLVESELPARFGGAPGDYQLAELEGRAQTEMVLRISPRTGVQSPAAVREFFLAEANRLHGGHLSVRMWKFTGGMRAVIEEPEIGLNGKVHPLRFRGTGRKSPAAVAR